MPPGTEQAIEAAAQSGRWEAVTLVVILIAGFAMFGYFIRQQNSDLRDLNKFCRTELANIIDDNTLAFRGFGQALKALKCVHDSDIDRIIEKETSGEDSGDGIVKRVQERHRRRKSDSSTG